MKKQTKVLLVLFAIVAVVALFAGIYALVTGQLSSFAQRSRGDYRGRITSLSLSPSSGTYRVGRNFQVKIILDTGGHETFGTDVFLKYNPRDLEVQDSDPTKAGVQIMPGTLYSIYVGNQVTDGKISISGIAQPGAEGYKGVGTFATVTFKALRPAYPSLVKFDFTRGSTTDCNVVGIIGSPIDLLMRVGNGSYTLSRYIRPPRYR